MRRKARGRHPTPRGTGGQGAHREWERTHLIQLGQISGRLTETLLVKTQPIGHDPATGIGAPRGRQPRQATQRMPCTNGFDPLTDPLPDDLSTLIFRSFHSREAVTEVTPRMITQAIASPAAN